MRFKTKILSAAMLSAFGMVGSAQAVHLSEDGRGQVLLYPYYSSLGGNDTIVSLVNTTTSAKAVKIRFIEAKNSHEVLDFNLYMSPGDAWAGVVTLDAASGNTVLKTGDTSCTVPAIPAAGQPFRNYQIVADDDRGGAGLARLQEGYVEIIEMGDLTNTADIDTSQTGLQGAAASATHVGSTPANCTALRNAWNNGNVWATNPLVDLTAPTGGLFGSATLINVAEGTDYSYDPVVLDAFSSLIIHTNPGTLLPSLNSAFPTTSVVFTRVAGVPQTVTSTWTTGVDAVSAVLMHSAVVNEFSVNPGLNAGTDWVVTFPTKRLYIRKESSTLLSSNPFTAQWDDAVPQGAGASTPIVKLADGQSTGACEPIAPGLRGREEESQTSGIDFSPTPPGASFSLCWEANVITFSNSDVLNSSNVKFNFNTPFNDGWATIGFAAASGGTLARPGATVTPADGLGHRLADTTGDVYLGLPVVGFSAQKFVNGSVGGVLSNYGGSQIHKYVRSITGN